MHGFFRPLRSRRPLSACISTEGSGQERRVKWYKRGKRRTLRGRGWWWWVGEKGNAKREGWGGRGWSERGKIGGEKRLRFVRASLASSHGKQFLNVTLSLAAGIGCTPRTALCKGAYAAGRTKRTVRNSRDERQEISEPREGK